MDRHLTVASPVIGYGSVIVITLAVVVMGIAEEKCSNCCELSIGLRATSCHCCEWNHCCEWSIGRSGVAVVSGVVVVSGVIVVS